MEQRIIDPSTAASAPGGIRIQRSEFARYYGQNSLGLRFRLHVLTRLPLGARQVGILWPYLWRQHREQFMFGDTNPVHVIDGRRGHFAAFTCLDTAVGIHAFPVIKIFKDRAELLPQPPECGDRFTGLSVYSRGPDSDARECWADFHPKVLECFVTRQDVCRTRHDTIPPVQWAALEHGLAQLPPNPSIGLYPITLPQSITSAL